MEKWKLAMVVVYGFSPVIFSLIYAAYCLQDRESCLGLGREEVRGRKNDRQFILGMVVLAIPSVFLGKWQFDVCQPGVLVLLACVIGIAIYIRRMRPRLF